MLRKLLACALLIVLLLAILLYSQRGPSQVTVSGVIEADEIRLGSRVGGRVARVLVEEGDETEPGELLVELEPFDLLERRAEAEAQLSQQLARQEQLQNGYRSEERAQAAARLAEAQAELDKLIHGPRPQEIEAAQAEVQQAEADLTLAEANLARARMLQAGNSITQAEFDRAEQELKSARARLEARRKHLNLLQEGTRPEEIAAARARLAAAEAARDQMERGYRREEIDQAYAAVRAAESARNAIDRQIQELKIVAPTQGTVDAIELQPGDLIAPNAPVVTLVAGGRLWVRAYVPENRLKLRIGDRLPVTVDSYPGVVFSGTVTYIARQAEFTPNNVQTPEERSQQVVRIKVDVSDAQGRLRPGMAADVWLEGRP